MNGLNHMLLKLKPVANAVRNIDVVFNQKNFSHESPGKRRSLRVSHIAANVAAALAVVLSCTGCKEEANFDAAYLKVQWEQMYLDGQLLVRQRKFRDALSRFEAASGFARSFDPSGYRLAYSLAGEAALYSKSGLNKSAADLYTQAAEVIEAHLKKNLSASDRFESHHDLVRFLTFAGIAAAKSGQKTRGILQLERALNEMRVHQKETMSYVFDPASLEGRLILVNNYRENGQSNEAMRLCGEVFSKGMFVHTTPELSNLKVAYAEILESRGDGKTAALLFRRERWIENRARAKVFWKKRNLEEAVKSSKAALLLTENVPGAQTARALSLLDTGTYMTAAQSFAAGKPYLLEAYELGQGEGRLTSRKIDDVLAALVGGALASGDLKTASFYLEKDLAVRDALFGKNSEDYGRTMVQAAVVHAMAGDMTAAGKAAGEAFNVLENTRAANRSMAQCQTDLGTILQASGQDDKAGKCYDKANSIYEKSLKLKDARPVIPVYLKLGIALQKGDLKEIESTKAACRNSWQAAGLDANVGQPWVLAQSLLLKAKEFLDYKRKDLGAVYFEMACEILNGRSDDNPYCKDVLHYKDSVRAALN